MKTIPLTQGKFAMVDDEDYPLLVIFKWCTKHDKGTYYAMRKTGHKGKTIYMHRQIMQALPNMQIDHRNHNGWDNRKQNLRICIPAQNSRNRLPHKNTSSQYKGVSWRKDSFYNNKHCKGRWHSSIGYQGKDIHLGFFDNEIEAAKAYDRKAKELFGEFAQTNFPAKLGTKRKVF